MYCTLVIAHTGQGKSTFVKNAIKGKPNYVFDVNNEYIDFNPAPHLEKNQFIDECMNFTDTFCVFEEATGFFRGSLSSNIDRMLVQKRHSRNRYFFLFHSIESVPPQIYRLSNYVVLFKTLDNAKNVERKYSRLLPYFLKLQKSPDHSKHIIKLI